MKEEFAATWSSIFLPMSLPHETLGVFHAGLLSMLAANDACYLAGLVLAIFQLAVYCPMAYLPGGLW